MTPFPLVTTLNKDYYDLNLFDVIQIIIYMLDYALKLY